MYNSAVSGESRPRFVTERPNITVAEGRDARLVCAVEALNNNKVILFDIGIVLSLLHTVVIGKNTSRSDKRAT